MILGYEFGNWMARLSRAFTALLLTLPFSPSTVTAQDTTSPTNRWTFETTDGQKIEGQWKSVTAVAIEIKNESSTSQTLPWESIVSATPQSGVGEKPKPAFAAGLVNGTTIRVQDFALTGANLTLAPGRQSAIELPINQVRWIRFRAASPITDPQWLGLIEKPTRSDRMVIRRDNDQLDPFEGVALGLDRDQLRFQLGTDEIDAPLKRLEGVVFRSAPDAVQAAPPGVQIRDVYGSLFLTSRLEPSKNADAIEFPLPGGSKHSVPQEQIQSIRWASGRVFLSEEKPARAIVTPYLNAGLPKELTRAWFGATNEAEDLVARSGTRLEYRVKKGFQTLAGSVSRDPDVAPGGKATVQIHVGDKVLWEQTLTDTTPKGFEISVQGASRIGIQVLAGNDGDVGGQVRFFQPRLLK